MRYYIMESKNEISLPKVEKNTNIKTVTENMLNSFDGIDYDMKTALISDRLKKLLELYMPKYNFKPFVYMVPLDKQAMLEYMEEASMAKGNKNLEANLNPPQPDQTIFWRFDPPRLRLDENCKAIFRSDGVVSHISFLNKKMPIVFTVCSPKGVSTVLVRMAVAESALRRNFLSLKFTKIHEI